MPKAGNNEKRTKRKPTSPVRRAWIKRTKIVCDGCGGGIGDDTKDRFTLFIRKHWDSCRRSSDDVITDIMRWVEDESAKDGE